MLEGKRAVVTGASMGIGAAVAARLASEGARVIINARDAVALDATAAKINQDVSPRPSTAGEAVIPLAGSVADYVVAGALVECCMDNFGGIDVLINCAGIAEPYGTSILDIAPYDWQTLIDIHLHATFNTCRQAAPRMVEAGSGSIINTSSHAFLGMYGGTGYAAGKGATNSLSAAMAVDLADAGVMVNVVCPGAKTRLSSGPDFEAHVRALHAKGALDEHRLASALQPAPPEYVASLYAVLASDYVAGTTGQIFWGSGGYIGRFATPEQTMASAIDTAEGPIAIAKLADALNLAGYQA